MEKGKYLAGKKLKKDFTSKVFESFIHTQNYNWVIYQLEDGTFWLDTDQDDENSICTQLGWSEAMLLVL
jgi:hypothetical protein